MAKSKTPAWHKHLLPKEAELINSVAISGDGSRVVAGTYFFSSSPSTPKTVGLFAFDNKGKSLWPSPDTYSATFGINWVSISRDGTCAASGGQIAGNSGFINAYDAASGTKSLTYNTPARVQMVALNKDGSCLVAGGDSLYVFARGSSTSTWSAPQCVKFPTGTVERIAVSDDGMWIAAAVDGGVVSLVQNNMGAEGGLSAPASWAVGTGWIMWVAMAADGSGFVAAGSDSTVYYFDVAAFAASPRATISPTWQISLTGCTACRSVAINQNGSLISAVADVPTQPATGKVFLIANQGSSAKQLWSTNPTTFHGVNSTSIDAAGRYITVADGNPAANVGDFYLFEAASGNLIWTYNTKEMNWPMQISADASAVAAGSDDGNVYYFAVP